MYIIARGVYIFYIMQQYKCTFMYIMAKGVMCLKYGCSLRIPGNTFVTIRFWLYNNYI